MTRDLQPVLVKHKMPKGHSRPHLIHFNDGNDYVVKCKDNPTGTRMLVNEYVAGELAKLLTLPAAPSRTVYITREFIEGNPQLSASGFSSGNQFASLYIAGCVYLPKEIESTQPIKITNREQLAGVIAFDYWLGNVDRNRKNLLLKPMPQGGYQFYMIDQGYCFMHSMWTVDTLQASPDMSDSWRKAHRLCFSLLQGEAGIADYIKKIIEVPRSTLQRVVGSIPADWEVSDLERQALIEYLVESQYRLPQLRFPLNETPPL
jgi:hypothetical protein